MTMSADDIRALYVETLARALYEQYGATGTPMVVESCREVMEVYVDALATAGLLPIGVECQIRPWPNVNNDRVGVQRYFTGWQELAE